MPGIKRNYPRYASIVSFMDFRRQPQRAKARQRKGKKRADDGNSLNLYIRHYADMYIYIIAVYIYIYYFIAIFKPFTKTSRQTTSLNILRYDRLRASLLPPTRPRNDGVNEIECEVIYKRARFLRQVAI